MEESKETKMSKATVPYPPDQIFGNKENRQNPADIKLREGNVCFALDRIEYKEGEGIFCHYRGVPYPTKGHVFPEAIYAVCQVKRLVIAAIKMVANKDMLFPLVGFLITSKKKTVERIVDAVIDIVDTHILLAYYLKEGYYSAAAVEIQTFFREALKSFGIDEQKSKKFGEIMCMLFQYDNAYYFRFVDIMSETSKEKMLNDFGGEVKRLSKILFERDPNINQQQKYKAIGYLAKFIYIVPSFRKAIKAGLEAVNFERWQMDEGDIYHTNLYNDYNYRGLTFEERIKEYIDYHGGEDKLPPRFKYWEENGEIKFEQVDLNKNQ